MSCEMIETLRPPGNSPTVTYVQDGGRTSLTDGRGTAPLMLYLPRVQIESSNDFLK